MHKKTLKKFFSVSISLIILICTIVYVYNFYFNQKSQKKLLSIANRIVDEEIIDLDSYNNPKEKINIEKKIFSDEELNKSDNVLGKIKIEKINVEAPVMDGTTQDILKISVGHFKNTSYWNGNVALASHNSGSYAHYFEKLNKLKVGDEIIYQTKLGTRIYSVDKIEQITEENLSVLKNTNENTITLITCVKGNKEARLCVKGIEKTYK